ncbi:MAG: hypothetical protein RL632_1829 [Bacteroidota bacterium]
MVVVGRIECVEIGDAAFISQKNLLRLLFQIEKEHFEGVHSRTTNTKVNAQKKPREKYEAFVIPFGFEPKTYCLEGSCSIQLSYGTRESEAFEDRDTV